MQQVLEDAAANVNQQLGPWMRESVFRDALAAELRSRGYSVSTEVHAPIMFKPSVASEAVSVGTHIADLVVSTPTTKTVVELKLRSSATALPQAQAYKKSFSADECFLIVFLTAPFVSRV